MKFLPSIKLVIIIESSKGKKEIPVPATKREQGNRCFKNYILK